jgi:PAS domain S-box-containing protein
MMEWVMNLDSLSEQIIASAADGIAVVDEDGFVVEWNPAAAQITGIPRSQAIRHAFWDLQMRLVLPENRKPGMQERYREQILEACRTGQAPWLGRVIEADILRADGTCRIIQQTAFPIRTDNGFMIGSSTRDVTERRTAERALAQREAELSQALDALRGSEERYRQMFENNQAIKWLVDPESGSIVHANEAAARFYGYTLDQLQTLTVFDLNVLPREQVAEALRHARSQAKTSFVFQHRLASGEVRNVEVHSGPATMQGRTLLLSIIHDVTERVQAEEALRTRNRQLEILHEIDRAILAAQSVETVAKSVVSEIRRLIPCERVGLMTFDRKANTALMLAVDTDGPTQLPAGHNLPLDEIWPAIAKVVPESFVVADIQALPELTVADRALLADGIRSYVRTPMITGEAIIGTLNLNRRTTGPLDPDHLVIARRVADSLAVAIQHTSLNEQVRISQEQLQKLSRRLVEMQEHERRYVAVMLYDDIGQRLVALSVSLRLLEQEVAQVGLVNARVIEMKRQTGDILSDLHSLAVHLRPASLETLGLVPALAQHLAQFGREQGLRVEFAAVDMERERLAEDLETALFWIVQEALTNIAQHAQASEVRVTIQRADDRLVLTVEDNGVGFDAAHVLGAGGFGLLSLHERAAMVRGSLDLETAPGAGTKIILEI